MTRHAHKLTEINKLFMVNRIKPTRMQRSILKKWIRKGKHDVSIALDFRANATKIVIEWPGIALTFYSKRNFKF